jgi:hypothetical protein
MLPQAPVTVEEMQIVDPVSYRITVGDKCRDICDYQKADLQEEWPYMLEWGTVLLKIRSDYNRRMEAIQVAIWNYQETKEKQSVDSVTC